MAPRTGFQKKGVFPIESYRIPAGPATARIVEKKSEFIAALAPAQTEEEALAFLESVRASHRTANHNVFAYQLRQDARCRYSDDGEPAKTAGLPVLGAITHADVTDCIIVVTRYFGGTLLGTGGLVRAYGGTARAALAAADILTMRPCRRIMLDIPYALYDQARRILDDAAARVDEPVFSDRVQLSALLPSEETEAPAARLRELLRGGEGLSLSDAFHAPY